MLLEVKSEATEIRSTRKRGIMPAVIKAPKGHEILVGLG